MELSGDAARGVRVSGRAGGGGDSGRIDQVSGWKDGVQGDGERGAVGWLEAKMASPAFIALWSNIKSAGAAEELRGIVGELPCGGL